MSVDFTEFSRKMDRTLEHLGEDFEKQFFENIKKFAFRKALCDKCHVNNEEFNNH